MTALICVGLRTCAPVAALPPKVTVAPARKFAPLMVIAVPPVAEPEMGFTLEMLGAGGWVYVNASASVPDCVLGLVTVTLTDPAAPAGEIAVSDDALLKTTPVAGVAPNVTVAPETKFAPLIVTVVPPAVGPEDGKMLVTTGAAV